MALVAELSALADLRAWEHVAKRVDAVQAAIGGGDGITAFDVINLRLACARWKRMTPTLREFYAAHVCTDSTSSILLWHLLFRPEPGAYTGVRVGHMRRLWADHFGEPPAVDLYPRLTRTTTT